MQRNWGESTRVGRYSGVVKKNFGITRLRGEESTVDRRESRNGGPEVERGGRDKSLALDLWCLQLAQASLRWLADRWKDDSGTPQGEQN